MIIALENLRSLYNVGAIMRTAEFLGFKHIALVGYSGVDPRDTELLHHRIRKTSLTAIENLLIEHVRNIDELLEKYPEHELICIENNVVGSKTLSDIEVSDKSIILFGNEKYGVEKSTLAKADSIYEIPRIGKHSSLNVEACAAVVLYQVRPLKRSHPI